MSVQTKANYSQKLNKIKDIIDSLPDYTTDKEIEQAPNFDELIKSANAAVEPTQHMPTIKITNLHETEFLEGAEELMQHAKLQNSEHKEQEDTTEEETKTQEGSLKLEN